MAEAARSQPATPELRAAILELIARPIYPFLITNTSRGVPYCRPVICVNDGFRIRMVTRRNSKKMVHLRHSPQAALLWSDPPRSVLLQGSITTSDDVAGFYDAYHHKNPDRERFTASEDRVVLALRPAFCRADWFAGYVPVVLYETELEGSA
ncbi:MAG: pyridoxamine 5'-phosphate oxidase family protein [Chloroflexi bacterium]|nr:pyridoxamine 5'-phosphate oxidase family protein [Chloroflexota bacterium]